MLADLLAEIERQGGYTNGVGPEPVVSLELFFDGNDDPGSIGCNLPDHPGLADFYSVLRSIRDRPEVDGVWVGISELMGPNEWPFTRRRYYACPRSRPLGGLAATRWTRSGLVEWSASVAPHHHPTWRVPGDAVVGLRQMRDRYSTWRNW
jgi:hypothetical protein